MNEEPTTPNELSPRQRHRAVRTVARHAHDAADLRELLAMLDLSAAEGHAPRRPPAPPARRKAHRTLTAAELTDLVRTAAGAR
ncbi:hypothetical protein [Amycolatopsis suaedae]|uniref:Uncharacterized protein n=1 Tax=Amycolatopsis suaedae TaxID=2510978 RepID=A0A4Q7JFD4_9PSEU|nr:hypothetical protein [Amycolatopsis suaedae]RZQ65926.1 hypothetical protein EWH70_02305 [Amycolatopsis suaedae]